MKSSFQILSKSLLLLLILSLQQGCTTTKSDITCPKVKASYCIYTNDSPYVSLCISTQSPYPIVFQYDETGIEHFMTYRSSKGEEKTIHHRIDYDLSNSKLVYLEEELDPHSHYATHIKFFRIPMPDDAIDMISIRCVLRSLPLPLDSRICSYEMMEKYLVLSEQIVDAGYIQ